MRAPRLTPRRRAPDTAFVEASRGTRTFPHDPPENYWFRRHEAAYRMAAAAVAAWRQPAVLDVGCGEGYGAALLARAAQGGGVTAVELDAAAARHAAQTYGRLQVLRADACALPFRPRSFDVVVAMQVLEHLFCADGFLRQVRTLLRPGGVLLLSTPNRDTFSPHGSPNAFHVYEYTAEELEALLRVHFRRVEIRGLHGGPAVRALDRVARGSLQHRLMRTPFDELPAVLRAGTRRLRARSFVPGAPSGSLDLLATAA